jgi:cytochrome c oxidase subunit 6a
MFAVRTALSRSSLLARQGVQGSSGFKLKPITTTRRSNQVVPKLASPAEMQAEAIAQLRARVRRQKEIMSATHHSEAEEIAEMWKWIKISFIVALPVCVLSFAKDIFLVEHTHRPHGPLPDYMEIQVKEFPWECETCALFDLECWKKCRAEKAAA